MSFLKTKKSLTLALTLVSSVVLTACQGTGGLGGLTSGFGGGSADPRLESQAAKYEAKLFGKSGVSACVGGALSGAAVGALSGVISGNSEDAGKRAAVGAAAGCAVGVAGNYYLETQRAKFANKEDRLNAAIADVKKQNEYIQADINNAKQVIKDDLKTLQELNKKLKAKSIENADAKSQLAKIDANIAKLKENRESFQSSLDNFKSVAKQEKAAGVKTAKLDKEIAEIQRKIKAYDAQITQISSQRTAIKLG